jgi:hypothetical protein
MGLAARWDTHLRQKRPLLSRIAPHILTVSIRRATLPSKRPAGSPLGRSIASLNPRQFQSGRVVHGNPNAEAQPEAVCTF